MGFRSPVSENGEIIPIYVYISYYFTLSHLWASSFGSWKGHQSGNGINYLWLKKHGWSPNKTNLDTYYWRLNLSAYPGRPASSLLPEQLYWKHPLWIMDWTVICLHLECSYIECGFALTSQHTSASNTICGLPEWLIHHPTIPDYIASDGEIYLAAQIVQQWAMLKQFAGFTVTRENWTDIQWNALLKN